MGRGGTEYLPLLVERYAAIAGFRPRDFLSLTGSVPGCTLPKLYKVYILFVLVAKVQR